MTKCPTTVPDYGKPIKTLEHGNASTLLYNKSVKPNEQYKRGKNDDKKRWDFNSTGFGKTARRDATPGSLFLWGKIWRLTKTASLCECYRISATFHIANLTLSRLTHQDDKESTHFHNSQTLKSPSNFSSEGLRARQRQKLIVNQLKSPISIRLHMISRSGRKGRNSRHLERIFRTHLPKTSVTELWR